MDYNKTINLPKTDFPMRAGLPKREPEMLKRWEEQDIYHEMLKKNEGKPLFNLHDGPPFSNGALHMGHALNKALKDFITRSYAMRGYYTPYIPGWDNHGMPIESAIIKQNKLDRKAMSVPEFRSACQEFAQHYMDVQMRGLQAHGRAGRLGASLQDHGPRLRGRGGQGLRRDVQEGLYLQGPQARVLVPPRRDRPGRGGDRVSGRSLHHRVCEVPHGTTTWASWDTLTTASSSS